MIILPPLILADPVMKTTYLEESCNVFLHDSSVYTCSTGAQQLKNTFPVDANDAVMKTA